MKRILIMPALLLALGMARAEDGDTSKTNLGEELGKVKGQVEGLNESYLETKTTVDNLSKLKVGGYLQGQYQYTDSSGAPTKAGGNFAANTNSRMMIRRGRLKTTYQGVNSKYVLEFEALPTGVSLKDAEIELDEPWLKTFSLIFGVQDRPFGYEIGYSSSSIETPERSRFEQAYFNGEKDLGLELVMNPGSDMGLLQYINLKAGAFTGMGGNVDEVDGDMDFIGRLGFKAPITEINMELDGGLSLYKGSVRNNSDTTFNWGDTSFTRTLGHRLEQVDRTVYGVDAQLYYDIPVIGGTSLRFEYEWGTVPGTSGSGSPYVPTTQIGPNTGSAIGAPVLWNRNISGWYVTWVQNLGSQLQGVVRYDVIDPNTDVSGSGIGKAGTGTGVADVAFSTIGFGGIYHWSGNLKFVAYYDIVTNENANFPAFTDAAKTKANPLAVWNSDLNDNVFTFRAQVKF